jgi:RNA polymerase sigma-70 factor (ECF subfamily)
MPHIAMYGTRGGPFANLYFGTPEEANASYQLHLGLESQPTVTAKPEPTLAEMVAVVVETVPASGSTDVEPGEMEIKVRFSKDMTMDSWSWSTAWDDSTPSSIGEPRFSNPRTCQLKVKLEPSRTYAYWLNSENFGNFRDATGDPSVPYLLIFSTKPK